MLDAEPRGDVIRYLSVFNHENQAAGQVCGALCEPCELIVGLTAYRALRAMLENKNRIGLRSFEKLFEILMLT